MPARRLTTRLVVATKSPSKPRPGAPTPAPEVAATSVNKPLPSTNIAVTSQPRCQRGTAITSKLSVASAALASVKASAAGLGAADHGVHAPTRISTAISASPAMHQRAAMLLGCACGSRSARSSGRNSDSSGGSTL